ncbi:MAG: tyrosine-type recombinase/integrase [Actinomycetota bacterium]
MTPSLGDLISSWEHHLRARGLSERTIVAYVSAMRQFARHSGAPTAGDVARRQVEAFLSDQLLKFKRSTAATNHKCIRLFFAWALGQGTIGNDPMKGLPAPSLEEVLVPVVAEEDLKLLLATCAGEEFSDGRDAALLRLFITTGARLSEIAGIRTRDLGQDIATVTGKGRRARLLPITSATDDALSHYLTLRETHAHAALEALWLSPKGQLTHSGIAQMLRRRSRKAGIGAIHPHQLRHTFAHRWLMEGGNEGDLMKLAGWNSPQMLRRYASSAAVQRALAAHKKIVTDL